MSILIRWSAGATGEVHCISDLTGSLENIQENWDIRGKKEPTLDSSGGSGTGSWIFFYSLI
jgi:hypothetical protein